MEVNGLMSTNKAPEKRNQSMNSGSMNKSKDKNFRIMKKTLQEKR